VPFCKHSPAKYLNGYTTSSISHLKVYVKKATGQYEITAVVKIIKTGDFNSLGNINIGISFNKFSNLYKLASIPQLILLETK